jgi:hypothetical protein
VTTARAGAPAATPGRPVSAARSFASSTLGAAILFGLAALALRGLQFGNPIVQIDDQFYLLVGDRMWHGALPYADLWDRKPIGLFLIYAAIRALGGDGVIQYQLVAALFAIATALVVRRIALGFATPVGALAGGLLYLAALGMFGGDGGQSPVFYNLFVALALWATLAALRRPMMDRPALLRGATAMALMGVAIQIKYTALFEGVFLGGVLLWGAARGGVALPRQIVLAACWALLGVAPTLAAWGWFALAGHGEAFAFANFTSVFLRHGDPADIVAGRLWKTFGRIRLLGLCAIVGLLPAARDAGERLVLTLARGWLAAALVAFAVFGTYFDHYALPLLPPLALAAARLFGSLKALPPYGRWWRALAFVILAYSASSITIRDIWKSRRDRGDGTQVRQMAARIRPLLTNCLYVYDGEPALYRLTDSCLPTRWPFPDHLNNMHEDGAVGVDALAETRRIMAGAPSVVVSSTMPQPSTNLRTWSFMQRALAQDYSVIGIWQVGGRPRAVYRRRHAGRPQRIIASAARSEFRAAR